jgi:hypothetical protein
LNSSITFFQKSAQRVSGNIESADSKINIAEGDGATESEVQRSKGFQLMFKNGRDVWREF